VLQATLRILKCGLFGRISMLHWSVNRRRTYSESSIAWINSGPSLPARFTDKLTGTAFIVSPTAVFLLSVAYH
jgi:hypothetical protein